MQGFDISFEVSPMLFLILWWFSTDESFCTFLNVDFNSGYRSFGKFSNLTPSPSLSKKICWMCYVYTWFFYLYFSKTLQRFTDSRPQGSIVIKRKGFEILNKYDIFQISFSNSYFQRKIIAILIKLLTVSRLTPISRVIWWQWACYQEIVISRVAFTPWLELTTLPPPFSWLLTL